MIAVYPVRMKIMEDNIVGLSVVKRHLTCHNTRFNPAFKMGNVANLNIGLSYQINVSVVNIVQIAHQTRLEVRVLSRVVQSHQESVQLVPLED